MAFVRRFALPALALAGALASPLKAEVSVESDVAFFQRVQVGRVDVTPLNVFADTRCLDWELCARTQTMVITAILHTESGPQQIVLVLGEGARIEGGYLVLMSAGVPPSQNGAIPINDYRLELAFVPDELVESNKDSDS
ncbi:MAG: hypothetical protein QNI87_02745 [Erythrobacter sp.]|uniref:hypothetical protein n=1 Tax=Erythrobacter sp. TaxID=1042 RepID=UPI002627A508|nr:hypothetical protein [Erythrobacter sp.]MDJ0977429.1 hypothetical protein [Erythrobacter sp.]